MKRMIVMFLVLCLTLNGIIYTNVFANSTNEYSEEMLDISKKLLTKLGVWDETKSGYEYITRAEIAKTISLIIVGTFGQTEEDMYVPERRLFNDLSLEHWACKFIRIVRMKGFNEEISIMNGDGNGNFRPDDYITYQELAKVLIVFTHWTPYVQYVALDEQNHKSMYPDLFYETARQIGLYPLEETKKTDYVTVNDATILLYNVLHIKELGLRAYSSNVQIQTDDNYLSRMHIYTVRGYAKVIDENKILIDGVEYIGKVDNEEFREGLVICFYKWDYFKSKEGDIKPIVFCHPISSLDFDNQKPIDESIPKMFQERYLRQGDGLR